jgi:protein involved in polysaccharide export with SLBB domain
MTIDEARKAIEEKLSESLDSPEISLDVFTYNSKSYYIIVQGGGFGDNIVKLPITGNETVLDAIANIQGLQRVSSHKMWIARPAPSAAGCEQLLPVDWDAITMGASTATNYQLLPGDRLFVAQDRLVALESMVIKLTSPFERLFGFSLLGAQTIQTLQRFPEGFRNF